MTLSKHARQIRNQVLLPAMEERGGLEYKIRFLYTPGNLEKINAQAARLAERPAFTRKTIIS